ncbi:hypothetical protein TWF696_008924 [Orbilia brochopaga]|uniref:Uncharacterized protein n=1 Tax=Orbilia brochopaga TaxID=3140254 RepID=A0AAV9UDJ8_9PEZI
MNAWVQRMLAQSNEKATFRQSIYEYMKSPVALQATNPQKVTSDLRRIGVKVLPGPYITRRGTELAGEILSERYQRLRRECLARGKKPGKAWRKLLQGSQYDLPMACEAFCRGFGFLTADVTYATTFEVELMRRKMATYVIPASWTKITKVAKT